MRAVWRNLAAALGLLGAVLGISAVFSMKGPLQDVHWDAPIYVGRAKEFAQTPYIRRYIADAPAIAERLPRWKIGEDTPYWGFLRLGNTMLLGLVASVLGANLASIYAGFLLYTVLLAAALVSSVLLVLRVADTLHDNALPGRALLIGTAVSGALYLASDAYRYLSGNQVSEVPALLLLGGSALALVEAMRSRSLTLAMVSGVLGFALYVVRVEAVWAYLAFLLAFTGLHFWQFHEPSRLREALVSGSTAFLLYLCYAWLFWPLADPRLLLLFTAGVQEAPQSGVAAVKLLVAAGGPLWVGLLIALACGRRSPALRLALIWLFLLLLPHLDALFGKRQTEMRMYAMVMAPLLIASSIGWASAIAGTGRKNVVRAVMPLMAICSAAIIALSHDESYQAIRQLPGGWRLQYVRQWLSPPSYERLSYPVHELQEISDFLYARPEPTVLIPEQGRLDEYLRIVWYLAPVPTHDRSPLDRSEDAGVLTCRGRQLRPSESHVMFCSEPPAIRQGGDSPIQLLYLRQRGDPSGPAGTRNERTVFQTKSLELVPLTAP